MPQVHSSKVSVVNTSQEITIANQKAFADYNSWYLLNDTFRVTIDGWTHVHVSGLPSTKVHFVKTVNLTGLWYPEIGFLIVCWSWYRIECIYWNQYYLLNSLTTARFTRRQFPWIRHHPKSFGSYRRHRKFHIKLRLISF